MLKLISTIRPHLLADYGGINNPATHENIRGLTGLQYLNKFLPNLITLIFIITAIAAFFVLLTGGIRFITSGGDKAQTEAARAQITNAMIGLAIAFAVYAILNLLGSFFGVNLVYFNIDAIIIK